MQSDEVMELARGRGRVKSLDSVAGGIQPFKELKGWADRYIFRTNLQYR